MTGPDQWLSLGDASELLGVHASTLRRWADSGRVPCQRTPGGHRRFNRQRLMLWVDGTQQAVPDAPESPTAEDTRWYQLLADQGLVGEMRAVGQRLSGVVVQFMLRRGDDERYLDDALDLGRQYGSRSRNAGVGLSEAAEAFSYYRSGLLPVVAQMVAADTSQSLPQLSRYEQIMNKVLHGLIAEYDA